MGLIEIKNLSYQRAGVGILKDICLELPTTGIVYLTGPNGGGKSTLLKIMAGLLEPTSGFVQGPSQKNFSLMSSLSEYNTDLPLNVTSVLQLFNVDFPSNDKAILLAKKWGIEELLTRQISRLSSGELQKIVLLAHLSREGKEVLLLDEPLSHIAPESSLLLWESIYEVSRNKLVVMITHHTHLIQKFHGSEFCVHQILHQNRDVRL